MFIVFNSTESAFMKDRSSPNGLRRITIPHRKSFSYFLSRQKSEAPDDDAEYLLGPSVGFTV